MSYIEEETAIDALCIWEEIIGTLRRSVGTPEISSELYDWICASEGVYQGRQHALELAPLLTAAWQQVQEAFDISFDWEFIPLALPIFAEKPFDEANTPQHADYVAKKIIHEWMREQAHVLRPGQIPLDLKF